MSQDYLLRPMSTRSEVLTVAEVQASISSEFPESQFGEGKDKSICLVYRDDEHWADLRLSDCKEKNLLWDEQAESPVEWLVVNGSIEAGDVASVLMDRLDLKDVSVFDIETIPAPPAVLSSESMGDSVATKWGNFTLVQSRHPTRWICPNVACSPNCFGEVSIDEESEEDGHKIFSERVDLLGEAFEKELTFRTEIMRRSAAEMKSDFGKVMLGMNLVGAIIEADTTNNLSLYYNLSYAEESGPAFYEVEVDICDNEVEYIGIMMQEPDSCGSCHMFTPGYMVSDLKKL